MNEFLPGDLVLIQTGPHAGRQAKVLRTFDDQEPLVQVDGPVLTYSPDELTLISRPDVWEQLSFDYDNDPPF